MRLKLALIVVGVLAALAVTGASAADFEGDNGQCHETPGEAALLRCPTGYVGAPYEVEIESEEGECERTAVAHGRLDPEPAAVGDGLQRGEHEIDDRRGEAERRLVEEENRGSGHECAGNRELLLLAAGQGAGWSVPGLVHDR